MISGVKKNKFIMRILSIITNPIILIISSIFIFIGSIFLKSGEWMIKNLLYKKGV